jgi:hypothetical protein
VIPEWNMVVARLGLGVVDPSLPKDTASGDPEAVEDAFFAKVAEALARNDAP